MFFAFFDFFELAKKKTNLDSNPDSDPDPKLVLQFAAGKAMVLFIFCLFFVFSLGFFAFFDFFEPAR